MVSTVNRRIRATQKCLGNRISDHIAIGLIAYTLLLIFMVTPAMKTEGMAIWPYFLLVGMVALMVPFCRNIERRWKGHEDLTQEDRAVARAFTLDRCKLWFVALGVPPLMALGFTLF